MKLYQIYFSPTGGTRKVTDIIGRMWNCDKEEIDLSETETDFSRYVFQKEDICMIAVPSFGGRVPDLALSRICRMTGGNATAVILAVYGNRAYEDTLLELKDTVSTVGFRCIAAVAAIAEHSIMHQFAKGRPDASDEKELLEFGEKIKAVIEKDEGKETVIVPGNAPYKEYHGVPFKPKAGKKCIKCGLCVTKCPVGAIPKEDPSITEETKCISCMRCTTVCPQHARELNEVLLFAASQKMKKVCSVRKDNELFIL